MVEKEIWVKALGYEQFYEISNLLRIKSLEQRSVAKDGRRQNFRKERFLKPYISKGKNRYYNVKFRAINGQKEKSFMLHRLIAIHFIPNPDNKPHVNHINGIKTDNRIENLEWCTAKENAQHSIKIGLQIPFTGEQHPNTTLTEIQVLEIRAIGKSMTLKDVGIIYGVTGATISNIINRKTWNNI